MLFACVSTTDQAILTCRFDAKMLNYEWTKREIPGIMHGLSAAGWVDTCCGRLAPF